jgi:hypothetical protein
VAGRQEERAWDLVLGPLFLLLASLYSPLQPWVETRAKGHHAISLLSFPFPSRDALLSVGASVLQGWYLLDASGGARDLGGEALSLRGAFWAFSRWLLGPGSCVQSLILTLMLSGPLRW